jgi:hypothetical protein
MAGESEEGGLHAFLLRPGNLALMGLAMPAVAGAAGPGFLISAPFISASRIPGFLYASEL